MGKSISCEMQKKKKKSLPRAPLYNVESKRSQRRNFTIMSELAKFGNTTNFAKEVIINAVTFSPFSRREAKRTELKTAAFKESALVDLYVQIPSSPRQR